MNALSRYDKSRELIHLRCLKERGGWRHTAADCFCMKIDRMDIAPPTGMNQSNHKATDVEISWAIRDGNPDIFIA